MDTIKIIKELEEVIKKTRMSSTGMDEFSVGERCGLAYAEGILNGYVMAKGGK